LHFKSAFAAVQTKKRKIERAAATNCATTCINGVRHVTRSRDANAQLLPEEQHKATDKRSEIVLAINFGRGT